YTTLFRSCRHAEGREALRRPRGAAAGVGRFGFGAGATARRGAAARPDRRGTPAAGGGARRTRPRGDRGGGGRGEAGEGGRGAELRSGRARPDRDAPVRAAGAGEEARLPARRPAGDDARLAR